MKKQPGFDPVFIRSKKTENTGDGNGAKEAAALSEYHRIFVEITQTRLHLTVKAEGRAAPWRRKTATAATRGANYSCLGDSTALLTLMTLHFMGLSEDNYPPNLSVRHASLPPLSVSFEG